MHSPVDSHTASFQGSLCDLLLSPDENSVDSIPVNQLSFGFNDTFSVRTEEANNAIDAINGAASRYNAVMGDVSPRLNENVVLDTTTSTAGPTIAAVEPTTTPITGTPSPAIPVQTTPPVAVVHLGSSSTTPPVVTTVTEDSSVDSGSVKRKGRSVTKRVLGAVGRVVTAPL